MPKPKIVVSAGGSNVNSDHSLLMEKLEALARHIDNEFKNIREELMEIRDSRRDDEDENASNYHTDDDMLMFEPNEARYDDGYHNQNSRNSYSYPSRNPNHLHLHFRPQDEIPHPLQYSKTSPGR
jgi:hypothetical protein